MQKNHKNKKAARAKDKDTPATSQMFNFTRDSYLERTSRPIYATGFLLPFIIFYEIGTILINTDVLNQSEVRVVAFVWLLDALESVGFGGKFAWAAPPLVVVAILIGLQLASRKRWSFNTRDILPMGIECIALAVPLIVLSLFLNSPAMPQDEIARVGGEALCVQNASAEVLCGGVTVLSSSAEPDAVMRTRRLLLTNIVTGIGAGIYEELVFRLILICLLLMLFQDVLGLSHKSSVIVSVLISAALFSAHHHIVFLDGRFGRITDFDWTKFCFRTVAGVYFAVLYAIRGFGITAGTHAFYNVIGAIVNTVFF